MSLSEETNFEEIEQYLMKFGGGDVVLSTKYFSKGLAVIYINHPGKKNALSGKMMVELRQCVLKLEQWKEGKAVLICGLGGNFCSGGDLEFAKASGTQKEALQMSTWMQDTLKRYQNLPMITVTLIQGPTIGGGAEISIWSDFIIAADDVKFSFVHGRMGLITAWGGGTRLAQKIGMKRALNLFLTSQVLNAQDCVKYDIADHIVPTDGALGSTFEWIDNRLKHHYTIVRSFKRVLNNATKSNLEDSLVFEKNLFSLTWGGALNREALAKNLKHVQPNNKKM